MRGVLIDGVTGAGRSFVLRGLQRRLVRERPSNTKLLFSEHYTERMLEHLKAKGTLTESRVLSHLDSLLDPLELLAGQKAGSKFAARAGNTDVLVVMERFLLGHVANMCTADPNSWPDESLGAGPRAGGASRVGRWYGGHDPDNRHMWRPAEQRSGREVRLFEFVKRITGARAQSAALRGGD